MNNIIKTNYLVNELLCEKNIEQAIDCEINLPDYCGDISRVLQCFAFPNITGSSVMAEKISIEGTTLVRLLYVSEGEIYSYEQTCPFSVQADISCTTVGAALELSASLQYVNCRAASSRRAEVHGAFVINAKLSACNKKEVIDKIDDENMQIRRDTITACSASGNAYSLVNVNQVVDIGTAKSQIKSILRNVAFADIIETKQVYNKILVKGELIIKTLYKSEDETLENIENNLPFSQILDIEGVNEDSTVDLKAELTSLEIAVKPTALGNMSLMDIDAVIMVNACSYNCIDFPVLKDAYSTTFESECNFRNVQVDRIVSAINETFIHSFKMNVAGGISKTIDVWCEQISTASKFENGELSFNGTLTGYVLYEDNNNELKLKEEKSEFCFKKSISSVNNAKCSPSVKIVGCDYTLTENGVDIRAKIKITAVIFENCSEKVVENIILGDSPLEKSSSLIIYYAKAGDELWNIARNFGTTTEKIMLENDLDSDILTNSEPLMIWS